MQPWQIARKSVVACVSDLSAKGIKPYVSMISIGIPKKYSDTEIEDLANGFKIASKEFGVSIVGGDTNESRELVIDCCMIGFSGNSVAKIPKRNGASSGDSYRRFRRIWLFFFWIKDVDWQCGSSKTI